MLDSGWCKDHQSVFLCVFSSCAFNDGVCLTNKDLGTKYHSQLFTGHAHHPIESSGPRQHHQGPLGLLGSSECLCESLCPDKSSFPAAETDEFPAEQRLKCLSGFLLHSRLRRRKHESEQTANTQRPSTSCWDAEDRRWLHAAFSDHVRGHRDTEGALKAVLCGRKWFATHLQLCRASSLGLQWE